MTFWPQSSFESPVCEYEYCTDPQSPKDREVEWKEW